MYVQQLHGTSVRASRHSLRTPRSRQAHVVATYCPYRTLGVTENADDKEIKKAYRKLALEYHPDISTASDAAAKFISIQEAYNILTGKSRGKETGPQNPSSQGSWDFHDWYWQFRMSRSWERQTGGGPKSPASSTPGHKQPEAKEGIRTQLAGLRHRAAIRRMQEKNSDASDSEQDLYPDSKSDSESAAHSAAGTATSAGSQECYHEAADIADGAGYVEEKKEQQGGEEQWRHQKPKFVATESRRAQVYGQLTGLKRKGHLKKQAAAL